MTIVKLTAAILLTLSVTACGRMDTATRNAPLDVPAVGVAQQLVQRNYNVHAMTFSAPEDIKVSEGNGYYPFSDVVWRGDPIGDRVQQIATIFETALNRNEDTLDGVIPVIVDLQLVRFHGVTERTRFSVGGVYNIIFEMTVRNAATGTIIEEPRRIEANLSAPGGPAAILADQRGQTEKVRVTDFLTQVMRDELSGEVVL